MVDEIQISSTPWFEEEASRLPVADQKRIARRLGALQAKGWAAALADGTIRHLRDGIWEVRVLGKGAYRLLFYPAPRKTLRAVVLTTCAAKSAIEKRRLLDLEIDRAMLRRDAWLATPEGE